MAATPSRPRSLKARALQWLAQREHSRSELRVKLLRRGGTADDAPQAAEVDALLDWLEAHAYLSARRFAEARIHARSSRQGSELIRHELARHGVEPPSDLMQTLQATEHERARALWARRFGGAAPDVAGRARQARFLLSRGFSGEVVHRVLREGGARGTEDDTD